MSQAGHSWRRETHFPQFQYPGLASSLPHYPAVSSHSVFKVEHNPGLRQTVSHPQACGRGTRGLAWAKGTVRSVEGDATSNLRLFWGPRVLSATCRTFHTCHGTSPCLWCLLCPHRSGMMAVEALLWGAEECCSLCAPVRGSPELC